MLSDIKGLTTQLAYQLSRH